ncbi:MAG TPA: lipopolysaccharide heptosyltransferase II [Desulfobacteraceae bacterium]|nr:lipopolysaccharide heptosyltransferase II [Desulfobacteraceae bacterium]
MLKVVGNKPIDKSEIKRILIRATNWVGDVVMTMPALEAVKENFPESSITVLAKPWVISLFEDHPSVNEIIPYRKGEGLVDFSEVIRIIGLIRRGKYDLAILFQNAVEAALLAYLGSVRFRVGYNTDGRGLLLTHRIIRNNRILKVHQVEYYLSILRAVGWKATGRDPCLYVAQKDSERAVALLSSNGIKQKDFIVGISPGAIFGGAKRWPVDRFARIGDWAVERWDAKVLIMGAQKEMNICRMLCDSMSHTSFNVCGRTSLGEAMGLVGLCRFFVTNDSGLMHIAAALGVPTLAIFGSTDPVTTGPRGTRTRIVKHDIDCAPCLKHECPTDHRCMLSIEAEEVWKEMEILRGKTK